MKITRRESAVFLIPALLIVFGVLGSSCSNDDNGQNAALQAAYMAALASMTAANTNVSTSTVVQVSTITALTTVTSVSSNTAITTIN